MSRYTGPKKLTLTSVKDALADSGMSITVDTAGSGPTGSGNFTVTYKIAPWRNMTAKKARDLAYETNDLDDAFCTGLSMASEMIRQVGVPNVRR